MIRCRQCGRMLRKVEEVRACAMCSDEAKRTVESHNDDDLLGAIVDVALIGAALIDVGSGDSGGGSTPFDGGGGEMAGGGASGDFSG